ncbi:MAG TPA: 3-hydroxyacyl-CoA dehydrogenase NAD-binding domain-containing protein [Aromatoleum sp.]|uniref:3-hydroxyacyl-CoA dehydrogenase NAD-binding domain-containing protein n=1 Tax=Aromatoleum sp. TaxID=2307007 RepID=UPI002B48F2FD|nr:3-hydroxyacyl-CoA dehydrogenase NAD-binding domain-containing protein [Aromatoleum sp.]HJV26642.1 3-hydroxyacyl-CoA dehydrogenase NAD-binding domain-containing protein [Aromatoleum sp.]
MSQLSYIRHGDIAVATVNNPPVNALSLGVRQGLMQAIEASRADKSVRALVIIGGGSTFVAGADINDFGKPYEEPSLYAIIDALMASPKPVIAAIHGTAFGGGLELALACQWRIASPDAQIGQPEVKLGLMPGGGGTQWWPRLAGPEVALAVTTSGNPVTARQAHEWGVIDRLAESKLLEDALAMAQDVLSGALPARRLAESTDKIRGVDPALFDEFRKKNARKWKDQLAPWKIVDCIEAACRLSFDEGFRLEKEAFRECEHSTQSRSLIHLFFAERAAGKLPDTDAAVRPAPVATVGVVGAGTMGAGIAMCFANAGLPVTLLDTSDEALARGMKIISGNYATSVSRGSLPQARADVALARIRTTTDDAALADADLIVEAVFEDMEIKQAVFRRLDAVAKPGAILATNTSTLDVDAIAGVTSRPGDVLGLHFFSPANVMRLLEVVRGPRTAPETLATAMAVARTLRKIAVVSGNAYGFIGNRILGAYGREADFLLEEGATPWQIDRVLTEFGFPMGLFAMRDMAGLDVIWRIRQQENLTRPAHLRYSTIADRICEMGRFGQKTGRGYYLYDGRSPTPDPEIEALIVDVSAELGITRKEIPDAEILQRLLCAMANEGARILEEGVALRAGDIDVVYVNGYGFPATRGGPMWWAHEAGLASIRDAVTAYHQVHGEYWTPSPLLTRAAEAGGDWDAAHIFSHPPTTTTGSASDA